MHASARYSNGFECGQRNTNATIVCSKELSKIKIVFIFMLMVWCLQELQNDGNKNFPLWWCISVNNFPLRTEHSVFPTIQEEFIEKSMAYMSLFCFYFSVRLGAIVTGVLGVVSATPHSVALAYQFNHRSSIGSIRWRANLNPSHHLIIFQFQNVIPSFVLWFHGSENLRSAAHDYHVHANEYHREMHFEAFVNYLAKRKADHNFVYIFWYQFANRYHLQSRKHSSREQLYMCRFMWRRHS